MIITKISATVDSRHILLEPTEGLYVKKIIDPQVRNHLENLIKNRCFGGSYPADGTIEVLKSDGANTDSYTQLGSSCEKAILKNDIKEVENAFYQLADAANSKKYTDMKDIFCNTLQKCVELSKVYSVMYAELKSSVFEGITADMATRRMKQAEYEIKDLKHLSNSRKMNRGWKLSLLCAVMVAIMAAIKNPRLYLVTALLLGMAVLNYIVMRKTSIAPEDASRQIQEQLAEFGAETESEMKQNVDAYCQKYGKYLRLWHECYKLEGSLNTIRNKMSILINDTISGSQASQHSNHMDNSLYGKFRAHLQEIPPDPQCPLFLNDALANMGDNECLWAMQQLKNISNAGRQIIILTSSRRELDFVEHGWIIPPAGEVTSTPFRVLG